MRGGVVEMKTVLIDRVPSFPFPLRPTFAPVSRSRFAPLLTVVCASTTKAPTNQPTKHHHHHRNTNGKEVTIRNSSAGLLK